jgi:hypothetical protein
MLIWFRDGFISIAIIFIAVVSISLNLTLCKRRVFRWDSNSSIWFIFSLSQIGFSRKLQFWTNRGRYREEDARIIARLQNMCLVEIIVGVMVTFIVIGNISSR